MFILILLIDRPYPASALRVYQEAADVPRTYIMVRKEMPFPSSWPSAQRESRPRYEVAGEDANFESHASPSL